MQTNLDAVCQFTIGQDAEVSEFHFKCVTFYKRLKREEVEIAKILFADD